MAPELLVVPCGQTFGKKNRGSRTGIAFLDTWLSGDDQARHVGMLLLAELPEAAEAPEARFLPTRAESAHERDQAADCQTEHPGEYPQVLTERAHTLRARHRSRAREHQLGPGP